MSTGGWVAGGLSLALAVLIPPFILFIPISFALAAAAGLALPRWRVLLVPAALGLIALPFTEEIFLLVQWAVVLELGLAGGIALRLRAVTPLIAVAGAVCALFVLYAGYANSREPACHDTSGLSRDHPDAVEFREGDSAWGHTCEAIAADGAVLGRRTYPSRSDWLIATGLLVGPLGLRAATRARPEPGS